MGMWGAAPRPGRGRALSRPENGEQSVQARSAKPSTATENRTPLRATNKALYKGNQTSKLPNFQSPLYPRHVCDVPTSTQGRAVRARKAHVRPEGPVGAWRASHAMLWGRGAGAPRRTENGACRREAPNLPRLRRTERPCGATAEGAVRERRSRSPIRPICPIGPTAKFDDVSRRVKREDDGREGSISGRLARKATGVSPSGFARTGVFAENESVNTNQPISQALSGAPASLRKIVTEQ